jgi:glycosyltransferase involved in cell wall biosynthesis
MQGAMKIIHALPRRMRFEAEAASSVELCVAEWVSGSRYRQDTTVFAEQGAAPLLDVDIFRLAPARRFASWHLAHAIRRQVNLRGYDLIVTQQHIPTAARIAAFNPDTPVILQTHNFIDPPRPGAGAYLRNTLRRRELARLAGITLVSEATLRRFESDWPDVAIPRRVVSNGFDFSTWHPAPIRDKTVIVAGRVHETKGILEAAQGIALFLDKFRDWRAALMLSFAELSPDYFNAVVGALEPVEPQTELLLNIPFARVKQITERAAISIVASKWQEPFGRTALEAHAGGAALISSQTGGLREISGDTAACLTEITGPAIATQLIRLATDEALRKRLAEAGMQRVRSLFPLTRPAGEEAGGALPICERLDRFYEEILERRALLRAGKSSQHRVSA